MPLVDSNDPATWDGGPNSLYRTDLDGVIHGFDREAGLRYYGADFDGLVNALKPYGFLPGQRIVMVGCAFGWSLERLDILGYGPVMNGYITTRLVGTDTSTWIHANKTGNSNVGFLNADINTKAGRSEIQRAFQDERVTIDWAISEDILPILSDEEAEELGISMGRLAHNVAHWITVGTRRFDDPLAWAGDPRLNWKTLEGWRNVMSPADILVKRGTSETIWRPSS